MENSVERVKNTKIVITNRTLTNLCGESKVNSATESCVSVMLAGESLVIEGKNLHIQKLDVDTGVVDIEGTITSFKFAREKSNKGFFKRIFS